MNYLLLCDPSGRHSMTLIERGVSPQDITVWEDTVKGVNSCLTRGVTVVSDLDELMGQRFSIVIGNPPYGKNANLAVKFLNKVSELSDDIRMVLPRTFRKPSIINRLNPHLHLVSDVTCPDDTFPRGIKACHQRWEVRPDVREPIETFKKEDTTDFVFLPTSEGSDCIITRVANAGVVVRNTETLVLTIPYHERSSSTTYFLKVKDESVMMRLESLQEQFIECSKETVGLNSLSIHDIVRLYLHD